MDPKVKPTGKRWAVLFVIFLGCVVGSFSQFVTTAFGGYLMDEIGLSTSQFGAITMCPMLTGIIFSIFAGTIADKKGVRFSVFVAGLIGIAGAALRIISASYAMLMISSFLLGFLPVFISSNSAKLISEWFPKRDISIAMGIFMAGGGAGNAIAQAITAYFGTFHNACVVTLFMMVIAYVLFLVIASDRPKAPLHLRGRAYLSQTIGSNGQAQTYMGYRPYRDLLHGGQYDRFHLPYYGVHHQRYLCDYSRFVTSAFATGIMIGTIFGGAVILKIGKGKFRIPSLIVGIIGGICVYVGWMLASLPYRQCLCLSVPCAVVLWYR